MTFSAALAAAFHSFFSYVDLDTPHFVRAGFTGNGMTYSGPRIRFSPDAIGSGVDAASHFLADIW